MEVVAILASTHVDLHGERIPLEALQSFVNAINSTSAIPVSLQHDPTIPPLGKVLKATFERTEDGEHEVVGAMEVFDDPTPITLADGTAVLRASSRKDSRPFVSVPRELPETTEVAYDRRNFESRATVTEFLDSITAIPFTPRTLVRKAWIPDPQLVITLSASIASYSGLRKIVERVGDKLADRISDDVSRLYDLVREAVIGFAQHAIPKNRPITYVLIVPTEPRVELVAKTNDPRLLIAALVQGKVAKLLVRAEELQRLAGATSVQFLLGKNGEWSLNYLLTRDGAVVGTPASFDRRARCLRLLAEGALSMDGSMPNTDVKSDE